MNWEFSFSVWIVNIWNSLPASVNSANNVNTFKNRLNRFWTNQELMYDCKSSLTGINNRSSVDNFDDTIFLVSLLCYESVMNVKNDVSVFWCTTWSLASVWIRVGANCLRELTVRLNNSRKCETALSLLCHDETCRIQFTNRLIIICACHCWRIQIKDAY